MDFRSKSISLAVHEITENYHVVTAYYNCSGTACHVQSSAPQPHPFTVFFADKLTIRPPPVIFQRYLHAVAGLEPGNSLKTIKSL